MTIGVWAHMNPSQVFARLWAAFDDGEIVTACAWCGRVRLDSDWFPPPPAALAAIDAQLTVSHSICNRCAGALLRPAGPDLGQRCS